MGRALMIVDPQLDFINGSLPVPHAAEAMNALADYVARQAHAYPLRLVTCDCHPPGHISFQANGGQWPCHCLAGADGASIWPVLRAALEKAGPLVTIRKGTDAACEEYSAFSNCANRAAIADAFAHYGIDGVDICGIAGDICVLNTLRDGIGIYGGSFFRVLAAYSPSMDNGASLREFCRKEQIWIR
ncbi:MAG: isochorismatase family protein [Desulfovibrio sp.]|nr:isochorismatase family protein [Desulfovibrio sp.]